MSLEGVIAVNRFGLGGRPGEIAKASADPKGWLMAQVSAEQSLPAPLATLPSTIDDQSAFPKWLGQVFAKAKDQGVDPYSSKPQADLGARPAKGGAIPATMMGKSSPETMSGDGKFSIEQEYIKAFVPRYAVAVKARFDTAVTTDRPFFERLVHFWVNHFVVSGAKPAAIALPPSFERDVIRPNVTGRFVDMLMASTKHPAMLLYLDNYQSIGPRSKVGQDPSLRVSAGRRALAGPPPTGLNENLAREILELQTLGVRSGYTQADVTCFAKILTGWTIARPPRVKLAQLVLQGRLNGPGLFEFDDEEHEPGAQTVMGKSYPQVGVDQGEAVLRDIAHHPATAHFIATKLARHFVADNPSPELVGRLATIFIETGGNLAKLYAGLVESPEAFVAAPQKFKTPEEYVISAARALSLRPDAGSLLKALRAMGQPPYNPPGPDGWPDVQAEWLAADSVWKRFEWADEAARTVAVANIDPLAVARDILGPTISKATQDAIARAESPAQGLTLLLASADFQRR